MADVDFIGRELPEMLGRVSYNFGCDGCGRWGILRPTTSRQQVVCPGRCGEVYVQWRDGEGRYRLSRMIEVK